MLCLKEPSLFTRWCVVPLLLYLLLLSDECYVLSTGLYCTDSECLQNESIVSVDKTEFTWESKEHSHMERQYDYKGKMWIGFFTRWLVITIIITMAINMVITVKKHFTIFRYSRTVHTAPSKPIVPSTQEEHSTEYRVDNTVLYLRCF
jgi:hypothetical protein